jgi:endonuclease/exonuclease/phosphatase (EEP) superfamily protein YafD
MTPPPATGRRLPPWLWLGWKERRAKLHRDALVVVMLLYAVFAFAYLLPPDFRNISPAFVLLAWAAQIIRMLQFHAGLLVLLIGIVALVAGAWRLALASAPLMLFLLGPVLLLYLPRSAAPAAAEGTLRVFSANLLMINRDTAGIIGEIQSAAPDILLLQEFTEHWQQALDAQFGESHPHRIRIPQDDSFGIAIYLRLPFVGKANDNLPLGDWPLPQLRVVIRHQDREIAVYNLHILPPRRLDYTTQHRLEFADLLARLSAETMPVLVTGDLNCTETTPQAYALRRAGFADAHDLAGYGRGSTWPVNGVLRYVPGLRLDHIYLSAQLTATAYRTGTGQGSDHRPLIADIRFK